MKAILQSLLFSVLLCISCQQNTSKKTKAATTPKLYIRVLGIAQDGGYPHIGCQKECCEAYYKGNSAKKSVVSLGLVDLVNRQKWLFDATPDVSTQLASLEQNDLRTEKIIDGIFLTHAHIGHYTGLMYLGREAYGKQDILVYAMPRIKEFIKNNGPWSQLVDLNNIKIAALENEKPVRLNQQVTVTPFLVPHRDEFSETVGYHIKGPNKSALYIPDIDKWHKWKRSIIEEVKKVDYAFVDATFLDQNEVKRAMTEVPHPFIDETISLFKNESLVTKNKVIFIHFNHTNPTLQENSTERKEIEKLGFRFASEGTSYEL